MRAIARALFALPFFLAACGGGEATPTPKTEAPAAPTTFAEQVSAGQALYASKCASCHGSGGEGTKDAPRLVGLDKGALPLDPPAGAQYRKTQFKTVADVAAFAVKTMPADEPGSLTPDQYWSVLAFDLHANGIDLQQKLDPALAPTLTIPRK